MTKKCGVVCVYFPQVGYVAKDVYMSMSIWGTVNSAGCLFSLVPKTLKSESDVFFSKSSPADLLSVLPKSVGCFFFFFIL